MDDRSFSSSYPQGITTAPPIPQAARLAVAVAATKDTTPSPFALRGCVLTPEDSIESGYVLVSQGQVASIATIQPPSDIPVIETDGVILPGLIDLHNHPEYNVFPAWEPPQLYRDRYEWRQSWIYQHVIAGPMNELRATPSLERALARYAEIRALIAGVTTIQGAGPNYPQDGSLIRNIDLWVLGQQRARSAVDLPSQAVADQIKKDIASGAVRAFYVHLAEGTDEKSRAEFNTLKDLGLLLPETVIIHGTALRREQLLEVREAGAKIVWSPQSNLRLYGRTTHAADALDLGIPLGIGADWLPSGSPSLLQEVKVARQVLGSQGKHMSAKELVTIVTTSAASIAGFGDLLGRLQPARPADILVLERRHSDPWENVVTANPAWVNLVLIGGQPSYGTSTWFDIILPPDVVQNLDSVIAWGKEMKLDLRHADPQSKADLNGQTTSGGASPGLSALGDIRSMLITRYPLVGPVFA